MVSLFKDRSPATVIWLLLLSIIVHSHFIVYTPIIKATGSDGLSSTFINNYLVSVSPVFITLIYYATVILQALRLNHLLTDERMYSRVTYLPAMAYILLTGLFIEWSSITPALISNTLVIWFLAEILHLNDSLNPKTLLFNIGLLIGISAILYHPLALLLVSSFFALIILRTFLITQLLVLLMGFLFPFYILICYLFLTDKLTLLKNYIPDWNFNFPHYHISVIMIVTAIIITLILFIGLYYMQQENRRLLIQVRNNWIVLVIMMIIMLPLPLFNKGQVIESLMLCLVPAASVIAKGFLVPKKNTLPFIMFWVLVILGILKTWNIIK